MWTLVQRVPEAEPHKGSMTLAVSDAIFLMGVSVQGVATEFVKLWYATGKHCREDERQLIRAVFFDLCEAQHIDGLRTDRDAASGAAAGTNRLAGATSLPRQRRLEAAAARQQPNQCVFAGPPARCDSANGQSPRGERRRAASAAPGATRGGDGSPSSNLGLGERSCC